MSSEVCRLGGLKANHQQSLGCSNIETACVILFREQQRCRSDFTNVRAFVVHTIGR